MKLASKKRKLRIFFSFIALSFIFTLFQNFKEVEKCIGFVDKENLMALDSCGKLIYQQYKNRGENNKENIIPDFSFAGYKGGGVAIPQIAIFKKISPLIGDAGPRIQKEINLLCDKEINPTTRFRGAILLEKGFYRIDNPLIISCSGIVLRGEGQNPEGTVLLANSEVEAGMISLPNGKSEGFSLISVKTPNQAKIDKTSTTRITSKYVAVGSREFSVINANHFKVGQRIVVTRTPNDKWLKLIGMSDLRTLPNSNNDTADWTTSGYTINHERTIVKIIGNIITIDIPIVDSLKDVHGGGEISKVDVSGKLTNIGIEDMRLLSSYKHPTDNNHAQNAISFNGVENVWVRGVTALHFSLSTVTFTNSSFATVEDTASLAPVSEIVGGWRYPFNVNSGGVGILFQRIFSDFGRHSFVTGAKATGPHVWVDGLAKNSRADEGPHHRWSTGLLYDNLSSVNLQNPMDLILATNSSDVLCAEGIKSGSTCCAASCGSCGGSGCGLRPGGGKACCTGTINEAAVSCDESKAPCVITISKKMGSNSSFAVQNRTTSGTGHGWTGAQVMFWKTISESYTLQAAPGSMNWAVGAVGKRYVGSPFKLTWDEYQVLGILGDGTSLPVTESQPRSLYFQQLQDRKGLSAVKAVTTLEQREGRSLDIINLLTERVNLSVSDPQCSSGIKSGNVCCPAACGSCGGDGCGSRPGGAKACCTNSIIVTSKSCLKGEAPCVIPQIRSIDAYVTISADPLCMRGIKKGNICYPRICKILGGAGCGTDPSGSKNCCSGSIIKAAISCSNSEAPCILPLGAY